MTPPTTLSDDSMFEILKIVNAPGITWKVRRALLRHKFNLSEDVIDNNGNYEPTNCRWVTAQENNRNKRSNRILTVFGEKMTLAEAAEKHGILPHTLLYRLGLGLTPDEAVKMQKRTMSKENTMEIALSSESAKVLAKRFGVTADRIYQIRKGVRNGTIPV